MMLVLVSHQLVIHFFPTFKNNFKKLNSIEGKVKCISTLIVTQFYDNLNASLSSPT